MSDKLERSTLKKLGFLAKAAVWILGFVYLCGFVVVSIHLSEYGIYSFALFRGQYIAAGLLGLCPLYVTYVVAALFNTEFEDFSFADLPTSWWPRVGEICLLAGIALMNVFLIAVASNALVDLAVSVFVPTTRNVLWLHKGVLLWLMLQSALLVVLVMLTWRRAVAFGALDLRENIRKNSMHGLRIAFCLLIFAVYMSSFSRRLYPEIPMWLGGGEPQSVVFLLKTDAKGQAAPLSRDKSDESRSIVYKLILETDTSYVVLGGLPQEKSITFNRDAVAGYVVTD